MALGLHQRYGEQYRLVLAGSPADDVVARRIQQAAGGVPLDNLCGQTSLPELAALLSQARLLISNDTVAAHLATQLGTPCLVVLMGENYGKFSPTLPTYTTLPATACFRPLWRLASRRVISPCRLETPISAALRQHGY